MLSVVNFMRHHQRQSVRKAHPTGNVSGGAFYAPLAAEIGAQSAPYGWCYRWWILYATGSGNWCAKRTLRVMLAVVNFMRHRQRQLVREAHPTGNVIGGEFYTPPAAEIGVRSAPYG
jgi:hypothetical protein